MKEIYAVLVEPNALNGPQAGLNMKSHNRITQIAAEKDKFFPPEGFAKVISGIGRAEQSAAVILGLKPDFLSVLCGAGYMPVYGQEDIILLPSCRTVPQQQIIFPDCEAFLRNLPDKSLLIVDRFFLHAAKVHDKVSCGSLTLFKISKEAGDEQPEIEYEILFGEEMLDSVGPQTKKTVEV